MIVASSLTYALAPRALSGANGKLTTLRGGDCTRVFATDNRRVAIDGGGCKWISLPGITTIGGLNGFHFGQNGDDYDPAKMIEQIYLVDCNAIDQLAVVIRLSSVWASGTGASGGPRFRD